MADPRLVTETVAAALDIRALAAQDLGDALTGFLSSRMLLLVVDNCEHVLAETAALADRLLRSAPGLTILATSREPLRVAGEVVFRVPSLDIPDPERALAPDRLLRYESVSLFVERAVAASPGFALDEDVAEDVARICLRLDGLPLALELAAGRLGALTPRRSRSGWTTGSGSFATAATPHRRDSRRWRRPCSGATTCCSPTRRCSSGGWPSSPGVSRSRRSSRSAPATGSTSRR